MWGPRNEKRRSRPRQQSPTSTVGQLRMRGRRWRAAGHVCDAQRRVTAPAHERGAVHALCKADSCSRGSCSLRGDTLANDAGRWCAEARVSERGRDGVAVPGAPARGWEERAAPIPKLAQARGDERIICVRACAGADALQAKAVERGLSNESIVSNFSYSTHRHLEEKRSRKAVTA